MAPPEYGTTTSSGPRGFTRRPGELAEGEDDGPGMEDVAGQDDGATDWMGPVHQAAEWHVGQSKVWSQRTAVLESELHYARVQADAHQHAASALQDVISSHDRPQVAESPKPMSASLRRFAGGGVPG